MSARADLCGGRSEMIVPTATSARTDRYLQVALCLLMTVEVLLTLETGC